MKFSFTKKNIIIIITILIVIILAITLPLVLIKSSNESNSSNQIVIPTTKSGSTINYDDLGFCHSVTIDGVDQPNKFFGLDEPQIFIDSRIGTFSVFQHAQEKRESFGIQYIWERDPNNVITMPILLKHSIYTPYERYNLGQAYPGADYSGDFGYYLVNKIKTIYDKNNTTYNKANKEIDYNKGIWHFNPYIITTSSQCK